MDYYSCLFIHGTAKKNTYDQWIHVVSESVSSISEVTDALVVIAGVSVIWDVLSWSGGHEFKPQKGWTWDAWYFCPKSYLNQTYNYNHQWDLLGMRVLHTISPSYVRHSWKTRSRNTCVNVPVPYLQTNITQITHSHTVMCLQLNSLDLFTDQPRYIHHFISFQLV